MKDPPAAPPIADACTWETFIHPDPGFETRWTRDEKEQITTHNGNVNKFCPRL